MPAKGSYSKEEYILKEKTETMPPEPVRKIPVSPGEMPVVTKFLCVGLASVSRALERATRSHGMIGTPQSTTSAHPSLASLSTSQVAQTPGDTDSASTSAQTSHNDNKSASPANGRPFRVVFVCRADMVPPHMYAHLPTLAYRAGKVLLVTLPKGAEAQLAKAIGVQRAAIIGVKVKTMASLLVCFT